MKYDRLKKLLIIACEEVRYTHSANELNEPGRSVLIKEVAEILMLELPLVIIEEIKAMKNPMDDYEEVG